MIINSILDTDLYKLSMQNAITKLYPRAEVRYQFIDRNATYFPEKMIGNEVKKWQKGKYKLLSYVS